MANVAEEALHRPAIWLFSDVMTGVGGIETYLDALARKLKSDGWPVLIAVSENAPSPFLDELAVLDIPVYRQPRVPGDRWQLRQRLLALHVAKRLRPGDWVYCVRQPMPEIYLPLVRLVHSRGAKIAASWAFAPEFLPPPPGRLGENFKQAVAETDAVVSVSNCTRSQFAEYYDYHGPVEVVHYHNVEFFPEALPFPDTDTFNIAFMGRIAIEHKNLDTILETCKRLAARRSDIRFNFHGGGKDLDRFRDMVAEAGLSEIVSVHGRYDHRSDLAAIMSRNHIFIYTSRFEGGPCFSLLELLQAGRFVVASPVGGIPDIYSGRPEIGTLVDSGDVEGIADALEDAVDRVKRNMIDPAHIRRVYEQNFSQPVAHEQWLRALDLMKVARPEASSG